MVSSIRPKLAFFHVFKCGKSVTNRDMKNYYFLYFFTHKICKNKNRKKKILIYLNSVSFGIGSWYFFNFAGKS